MLHCFAAPRKSFINMSGSESLATDIVSGIWWDGDGQRRVDHRGVIFQFKKRRYDLG